MPDLARLLDQMSDAAVCCDRDGIVLYVNTACCRMFERSPSDLLGKPFSQSFSEPNRGRIELAFERAAKGSESDCFELFDEIRERWSDHRVYAVTDRICAIVRDVTEEKQTAARFEILANASREFAEAASDVRTV